MKKYLERVSQVLKHEYYCFWSSRNQLIGIFFIPQTAIADECNPDNYIDDKKIKRITFILAETLALMIGYYLRKVPMTGR